MRAMRLVTGLLPALVSLCLPGVSVAAGPQRFDGLWQTTLSCGAIRDALGFSFRFTSTVQGGVLHGSRGTPGEAGFLRIDGTIDAEGIGKLYAISAPARRSS